MEDRKEEDPKENEEQSPPLREEGFETEGLQSEAESPAPSKFFHSSQASDLYATTPTSSSGKKRFLIMGIVGLVIAGAIFYFLKDKFGGQTKVSPSPAAVSPIIKESPSPSPEVSFERSKYTIRVLNGTKLTGMAASTSAKLKDLGYKIERTGNATDSAFLKTVVRVKPDLEELLANLLKDLSALDFKGEEGLQLKDSDTSDGEVILGED